MAAKKATTQAAAKQPAAKKPAEKPDESKVQDNAQQAAEAATPGQPGTGAEAQATDTGEAAKDSSNPPTNGDESVKAPAAPETKPQEGDDQSKEPGAATEGNHDEDEDQEAPEGTITLEVVTRLLRRVRGGVIVTQEPQTVTVTQEVAERLAADPHISVKAK